MKGARIWRWIRHSLIAMAVLLSIAAILVYKLGNSVAERILRKEIVTQLEDRTGARVEMGGFHLQAIRLRAQIDNLTLHGREPAGSPPLFHAAHIDIGLKVLSFFGREIKLDELVAQDPELNLRIDKSGASNIPTPRVPPSNKPWQDTLFGLRIGMLDLQNGAVTFNDQKSALNAHGRNFHFHLAYDHPLTGADSYIGDFEWYQIEVAAKHDTPFRFDTTGKFLLHRDSFELTDFNLKLPHSNVSLRAELSSFENPAWDLHYRGRLTLEDVRMIVRQPLVPDATADFSGNAHLAANDWSGSGHFSGHDIKLPYEWFHATNLSSWGDFQISKQLLVVPNFNVRALEGALDGRVEMDMKTLAFKTNTHLRGASLADAFDAVNNPSFPLDKLHWEGVIDVVSENTWVSDFQHFRTRGDSSWTPPTVLDANAIPVTALVHFDYVDDKRAITLTNSEITTPHTQIDFNGFLGGKDSTLDLTLNCTRVRDWESFVNYLIDPEGERVPVEGELAFKGRILGPIGGPSFAGHAHATNARYDTFYFDDLNGDIDYSVDGFRFAKATVRRGDAVANMDMYLGFDHDWGFTPDSQWSVEGSIENAPSSDIQALLGLHYAITAKVSGTFRAGGTRAAPTIDANGSLENIDVKGYHLDSFTGELRYSPDEIRISRAELRRHDGRISGNLLYRPVEQTTEFALAGLNIPIAEIKAIQTANVPLGGTIDFNLRGSGPVRSPEGQGDFHVVALTVGNDDQGDFIAHVTSDGSQVHLDVTSEKSNGNLAGQISLALAGDQEISGKLTMKQFDLDPLLKSGLHLKNLTKHSVVDGEFALSGELRKPDTIEVDANISFISFDYLFISLRNDGPVQFAYRRNEVRINQARITGTNSNFEITGSARFDRDRPVHVNVTGAVNLGLLKGLVPDLQATGEADANVAIQGTLSKPRITGRATVKDASAFYAESPIGLSNVKGELVFDSSRLLFENLTADSGGGTTHARWERHLRRRRSGALRNHGHHESSSRAVSRRDELARGRQPATERHRRCGNSERECGTEAAALCSGRGYHFVFRAKSGDLRRIFIAIHAQPYVRRGEPHCARRTYRVDRGASGDRQ